MPIYAYRLLTVEKVCVCLVKNRINSESPLDTNLLPFLLEFLVSGLETEKHLVLKCVGTFVCE